MWLFLLRESQAAILAPSRQALLFCYTRDGTAGLDKKEQCVGPVQETLRQAVFEENISSLL